MMKWGFAVNAFVGVLLVVPAVTMADGGNGGLEEALDRTIRGIEGISGLQKRLENGDRAAIPLVTLAVDAPSGDPRAEEARLAELRREVSRLQMVHDGIAPADTIAPKHTHNLDPVVNDPPAVKTEAAKGVTASLKAYETAGFSADPVKQGEAYYHAGRYDDAVKALAQAPEDSRALYWTGRSLEKQGRVDDAIATYTKIGTLAGTGWVGERARADLEFLAWKKALEQKQGAKKP